MTDSTRKTVIARQCFYIPLDQFDDMGYIPSLITENVSGHVPLTGNGTCAQAWHWGRTREAAMIMCEQENTRLGITPADTARIILSSMADHGDRPGE